MNQYLDQVKTLRKQEPPAPWKHLRRGAGGITHVGYASDSDLLLVISNTARGVFDCLTGELVALEETDESDLALSSDLPDPRRLTAPGIGPLQDKSIRVAGLYGGGLPTTSSHWYVKLVSPYWPSSFVILGQREDPWTDPFSLNGAVRVGPASDEQDILAYGFSETGKSFVVVTPQIIDIYVNESLR